MLHIPEETAEKFPIVCIFHGFTGNKMEPHFIFVKLSRMLEARGIASVRFDFGGSGESDGYFIDMTISHELEEAVDILNYVRSLKFVDKDKIGVLGLSLGGAVASMLAGICRDDVNSLCLWAPAGNMGELVTRGRSDDDVNKLRSSGYWDVGGLLLGSGFIEDVMNLDIYAKAEGFDKNVLILHGDKDQSVPVSTSERYLEIYETHGALHIIEGSDHTFNKKEWEEEVLDYTMGFFEEELK
jgi:pimeloyl-ACP methyl ester carboxylesterase